MRAGPPECYCEQSAMANKKIVSKVDEKLKAAEARRAELERAKTEEQQRKQEMRRNRVTGSSSGSGSGSGNTKLREPAAKPVVRINVRDYGYLRVGNCDELIRLNWRTGTGKKPKKSSEAARLLKIAAVEKLIEETGEFDLAEVVLGILRRSVAARHPIQNKFAHLHGRIAELKERNKRAFTHDAPLNFTGSISPVRLPDFEADLTKLSRLSSPLIGMEEIAAKYANIEDLKEEYPAERRPKTPEYDTCSFNPYDHDLIPDDYELPPPLPAAAAANENYDEQTNFPTVISPMKRPQKDIDADVVYTPQRKSARRLGDDEVLYDDEQVSQILLNDPNSAFIANPYITTPLKKHRKPEE